MHHRLAIGAYKQACLRLFAEILWYNFEGTTYDTRSRKSCLGFRVCGNYALMRVVHCGVLAARASPIHMDRTHAVGSCLHTSCFDQNPTHARDHREGCI